jgi:calcineurin-like phosphoesterase family protein
MGLVYVIGDLHFGHENLAKHRGFVDAEQQDNYIISQWNKTIYKRDTVYILGDIAMEKHWAYKKLDQLNGIKKVVLGNHDKGKHVKYMLPYVNSVSGMIKYNGFWLTHCPIHPNELRGHINVHGHVHLATIDDDRYINVSADVVDYTPQLLTSLIK